MDYQRLLLDHLDVVDQIVRTIGRRRHLSPTERDDFASFVNLRLVDDDYAILRKFQNRSSLWTYLAAVIERLSVDFCAEKWGRWHPRTNKGLRIHEANDAPAVHQQPMKTAILTEGHGDQSFHPCSAAVTPRERRKRWRLSALTTTLE